MSTPAIETRLETSPADARTGYKAFQAGPFRFSRDEYFAHVDWKGGTHILPADAFLRALMRDVAWGFFYGTVNFDEVLGTTNYYGEVEVFVGAKNEAYKAAGRDVTARFKSDKLMELFKSMLDDWTNEGFDPFAAPQETGTPWGPKHGENRNPDQAYERMSSHYFTTQSKHSQKSNTHNGPCNQTFPRLIANAFRSPIRCFRCDQPAPPHSAASAHPRCRRAPICRPPACCDPARCASTFCARRRCARRRHPAAWKSAA